MSEATEIVAIDGPAGAGKSSAAREAARRLGYAFLDTGAMYRAATWLAMERGLDLEDAEALAAATRGMRLDMPRSPDGGAVQVDGHDVTAAIRTPEVTRLIYKLDQQPAVRAELVARQRAFGEAGPTVAEGRDIGTVVFPKARCKIYLDASIDERARRRAEELAQRGTPVELETLRREIAERDDQNYTRAHAPLRPAEDAERIDTTDMTLDEVVEAVVQLARERIG